VSDWPYRQTAARKAGVSGIPEHMYCNNYKAIENHSDRIQVLWMRQENVTYFTEKEEEFANLLIKIGTHKNIAKVLVFLAKTPKTTSHAIERGTDLRQPEVSTAVKYIMTRGWIRSGESSGEGKGRPTKIYELAKPLHEIMDCIENEKKTEARNQLALVQKLREHIRCNYNKLSISLAPFYLLFYSIFSTDGITLIFAF
jgi:predicted transcriptional regulator